MDIQELIPQRPPMMMIDQLLSCQEKKASGIFKIEENNVFVRLGKLTESGMIEALAQTAAARTGYILHANPSEKPGKIPIGVIGSIKDFQMYFHPKAGDEMIMEVEVAHEFMNASVVNGYVTVNGEKACQAELKIFITDDETQ